MVDMTRTGAVSLPGLMLTDDESTREPTVFDQFLARKRDEHKGGFHNTIQSLSATSGTGAADAMHKAILGAAGFGPIDEFLNRIGRVSAD